MDGRWIWSNIPSWDNSCRGDDRRSGSRGVSRGLFPARTAATSAGDGPARSAAAAAAGDPTGSGLELRSYVMTHAPSWSSKADHDGSLLPSSLDNEPGKSQ